MKKILWLVCVWALVGAGTAQAATPKNHGIFGDDDPYPLSCLNFSGNWKSDAGDLMAIEQGECLWLTVRSKLGPKDNATTILPDNKEREITGTLWKGLVRHRWNNKTHATSIETHLELNFSDKKVQELVLLERVSPDLLLQSTYRTTTRNSDGEKTYPPQHEYEQVIYRRLGYQYRRAGDQP